MRLVWCLVAAAATACGGGASHIPEPEVAKDDSFPQPPPEPTPVEVDLIADVATLAPGAETRVAVRFAIRPGWKIYWTNPGEAGLPTVADIDAPEGFEVSELAYPAPHPFEGPGGVRSYGYSKEVLVSAVVRAPAVLAAGDVTLAAEASWLACKDTCVRGRERVELGLPVVPQADAVIATNRDLFARHLTRVPVPLDRDACSLAVDAERAAVIIDCAGVQVLELYPAGDSQPALDGQLATPSESGARLRVGFKPGALPARVRGVLRAEVAGGNHYYRVDETLSGLPAAPTGAAAR